MRLTVMKNLRTKHTKRGLLMGRIITLSMVVFITMVAVGLGSVGRFGTALAQNFGADGEPVKTPGGTAPPGGGLQTGTLQIGKPGSYDFSTISPSQPISQPNRINDINDIGPWRPQQGANQQGGNQQEDVGPGPYTFAAVS